MLHKTSANQSAAANHRPGGQLGSSDNLSATIAADRAFPVAVVELDRSAVDPGGETLLELAAEDGCAALRAKRA